MCFFFFLWCRSFLLLFYLSAQTAFAQIAVAPSASQHVPKRWIEGGAVHDDDRHRASLLVHRANSAHKMPQPLFRSSGRNDDRGMHVARIGASGFSEGDFIHGVGWPSLMPFPVENRASLLDQEQTSQLRAVGTIATTTL